MMVELVESGKLLCFTYQMLQQEKGVMNANSLLNAFTVVRASIISFYLVNLLVGQEHLQSDYSFGIIPGSSSEDFYRKLGSIDIQFHFPKISQNSSDILLSSVASIVMSEDEASLSTSINQNSMNLVETSSEAMNSQREEEAEPRLLESKKDNHDQGADPTGNGGSNEDDASDYDHLSRYREWALAGEAR